MMHYSCKCGFLEGWFSGIEPTPCDACPRCHTTVLRVPATPHEFIVTQVDTDEGKKPLSRCRWCMRTRASIEAEQPTAEQPNEVRVLQEISKVRDAVWAFQNRVHHLPPAIVTLCETLDGGLGELRTTMLQDRGDEA